MTNIVSFNSKINKPSFTVKPAITLYTENTKLVLDPAKDITGYEMHLVFCLIETIKLNINVSVEEVQSEIKRLGLDRHFKVEEAEDA